jgi:hypothetical protein
MTDLEIATRRKREPEQLSLPGYAISEFIAKTHFYYTNLQRTMTNARAKVGNDITYSVQNVSSDQRMRCSAACDGMERI